MRGAASTPSVTQGRRQKRRAPLLYSWGANKPTRSLTVRSVTAALRWHMLTLRARQKHLPKQSPPYRGAFISGLHCFVSYS